MVPVVNENDTVATDELRFGDNDTLAALVANLVEAELLILLTDQDGIFDSDPRSNPDARLIQQTRVDDPELDAVAGGSGRVSAAAVWSPRCGPPDWRRVGDAHRHRPRARRAGAEADRCGEGVGTLLVPVQGPQAARKHWLAGQLQLRGRLTLDAGAVRALRERAQPAGGGGQEGRRQLRRGEVVSCVDEQGREVARGLINYDAQETARIMGQPSARFAAILGYLDEEELIHRDNLVLV